MKTKSYTGRVGRHLKTQTAKKLVSGHLVLAPQYLALDDQTT